MEYTGYRRKGSQYYDLVYTRRYLGALLVLVSLNYPHTLTGVLDGNLLQDRSHKRGIAGFGLDTRQALVVLF